MISGARGYENCLSPNTVVTVFFLEHVFACCHGVSPTHMQTYLQPKTQEEPSPHLGNSFSAQLSLFGKCVLQILVTSISLNANVGPLKSVKLPGSFWIPLSALQSGCYHHVKAWNVVGCISFISLISGIQACGACCLVVLFSFLAFSCRSIILDSINSSGLEAEVLNYKKAGPNGSSDIREVTMSSLTKVP